MRLHERRAAAGVGFAGGDLVVDPRVGFFQAIAQTDVRFPVQIFFDQRVVAVAAVHALGRLEIVPALELDAGDGFDDVDEAVDRDDFAAAEVDRFEDVAVEDLLRAFQAIRDVHEAAGLIAVAPDFDLVFARTFRLDDFPADGRRGFLASAVEGAVWSVDVGIAGDAGDGAEVLAEMAAHAFAEKFLPAVTVLGHGGIGVGFLEGDDVFAHLFVRGVNAGGGGVEETFDAGFLRGHEQVGVDEHREHAERAVVFDEAHAAHVGGEIVNDGRVLQRLFAGVLFLEIELEIVDVGEALVPFVERFQVHGPHVRVPLPEEVRDEVAADESAAAAYNNFLFHTAKMAGVEGSERGG